MKSIVNKTHRPLRVPLPHGKVLHLGAHQTGQISFHDVDHPPLQKMVEAGEVELRDEAERENMPPVPPEVAHRGPDEQP